LFDGTSLDAWKIPEGDGGHWKITDGVIDYDGKSEAKGDKNLWTKEAFRNFVLKIDWRFPREPVKIQERVILPSGETSDERQEVLDAGDSGIFLRGTGKAQINIWCWPCGSGEVWGYRNDKNQPPEVRRACTPLVRADKPPGEWNTFEITMTGDRLTVVLNDQKVIDNAQLPGVPEEGPIALQHHGDPIQFRNIAIKKLED
ncbi:MAG: DUF1080 domain-containing protein, partial [Armatimonadota bacterium]